MTRATFMPRCRNLAPLLLTLLLVGASGHTQSIPASQARPELVLQTGQVGGLWAVAFSPDGMLLAAGTNDRTVDVWDVKSGNVCERLGGLRQDPFQPVRSAVLVL